MNVDTRVTVGRIMSSKKYRFLYQPTVERILADVIKKYPPKKVEKEARRKLHQLWGAYFTRPAFEDLLERAVKQKESGDDAQTAFTELLALQTSSKERTPFLDHFYTDMWKGLSEKPSSEPRTIVEYGCGINALTYPWMGDVRYAGYDVDHEVNDFMNSLLTLYDLQDRACTKMGDVLIDDLPPADAYLLLKLVPLLEHQEKNCTLPLLKRIPARDIVVSFPTRSISGRDKGMEAFYRKFLTELISGEGWEYSEMCFDNELVFVVRKG